MKYYSVGHGVHRNPGWFFVLRVITLSAITGVALWQFNATVAAVTPPDSCFAFSAGVITDYYDNENNNPGDTACPKNVDIPSTISGTPVTSIGENSFVDSGITALSLPPSVTVIESAAFTGLALTSLNISAAGDLLIDNGAFSGVSLTMPSLTIEAAGNLTALNSFTGGISMSGTLTLHAGGNLETANGLFAGNTLGAVQLTADIGSITFNSGSFSSTYAGQVSMSAGTDITIAHGSFDSMTGLNLQAGGNITIQDGAFSRPDIGGSLLLDAGGAILIDGAMSAGSFTDVNITAVDDITLGDTVLGSQSVLTAATLNSTAGAIRINSAFYGSTGSTLTNLTLRATDGLYVNRGFLGDNSDLEVHLDVDGDVVIENSSFTNAPLDSLNIDTTGSITVDDTAFGGIGYIRSVNWKAGGNITLIGPEENWGSSSWWGNQYYSGFTTAVNLQAGNNLTVGDRIFAEIWNLESLSLQAGGDAYFGDRVFSYSQLASALTLPAGTTYIGEGAFSFSKIHAVYLQGATPTIGDYAFSFAGVTTIWPPDSSSGNEPVDNFENVQYVQLYTDPFDANPGGYSHTTYAATPVGMSGDWGLDRPAGGYIVNPATYTVDYESSLGETLAPQFFSGTGPTLADYTLAANPSGEFGLYYLAGHLAPLTAPDVDSYVTPSAYDLSLVGGPNIHTFIYGAVNNGSADPSSEDVPDENLANTGISWSEIVVLGSLLILGSILIINTTRRGL